MYVAVGLGHILKHLDTAAQLERRCITFEHFRGYNFTARLAFESFFCTTNLNRMCTSEFQSYSQTLRQRGTHLVNHALVGVQSISSGSFQHLS